MKCESCGRDVKATDLDYCRSCGAAICQRCRCLGNEMLMAMGRCPVCSDGKANDKKEGGMDEKLENGWIASVDELPPTRQQILVIGPSSCKVDIIYWEGYQRNGHPIYFIDDRERIITHWMMVSWKNFPTTSEIVNAAAVKFFLSAAEIKPEVKDEKG